MSAEAASSGNPKVKAGIIAGIVAVLVAAAIWCFLPYNVTYDLNGGTVPEGANPDSVNFVTEVTLVAPEKEGYVFAGWQGTGIVGTQKEVTIPMGSTGDREYKAVWHELISLNVGKVVIDHGFATVVDDNQTVKLALWGKPDNGDDVWEPIAETTYDKSSKNVEMNYSEKQKTTVFTLKKGEATFADVEDAYKSYMIMAENGADNYDVDQASGAAVNKDKAASFKMVFNPDCWKMHFTVKAQDKNVADNVLQVGVRVTCWNAWLKDKPYKPINQHKDAYLTVNPTTKGTDASMKVWKWDTESGHSYPESAVSDPQSYYFNVEIVGYKLTDGTMVKAGKDSGLKAKIVVKNGKKCGDKDAVYLKQGKESDIQKGELTITLSARDYTVTLDPGKGKLAKGVSDKIEYTFGEGADLPGDDQVTRTGYNFAGWFTKNGVKTGKWGEVVPAIDATFAGDKTLYAKWEIQKFNVSFNTNGGSKIADQAVKYGETVAKPKNPTLKDSKFDGWYTDKDCEKAFDFKTKITEDITLYAKWIEK